MNLSVQNSQTMSSAEIAALTDKRHDHVLRDVREQLYTGLYDVNFDTPSLGYPAIQGLTAILDSHTKRTKEILLDRYHTDILISGYEVKYRAAIVKRWHDLELMQETANPVLPAPVNDALAFAEVAARMLNMSDTSKLRSLGVVAKRYNIPSNILPSYSDETLTRGLGDLLKDHGLGLSAIKANLKLEELGLIRKLERRSTGKETKVFWSITDKGLQFGKNETSPQNPNQTQPRWFVDKFPALVVMLESA